MVTVKFFNLIRSNHGVQQLTVSPGTIENIMIEIRNIYPQITLQELHDAILFINKQKVMHLKRFKEVVKDGDEIVFTNFVGGG
mgnify:CR=1 FL=1